LEFADDDSAVHFRVAGKCRRQFIVACWDAVKSVGSVGIIEAEDQERQELKMANCFRALLQNYYHAAKSLMSYRDDRISAKQVGAAKDARMGSGALGYAISFLRDRRVGYGLA
jgi:hypothetical protein